MPQFPQLGKTECPESFCGRDNWSIVLNEFIFCVLSAFSWQKSQSFVLSCDRSCSSPHQKSRPMHFFVELLWTLWWTTTCLFCSSFCPQNFQFCFLTTSYTLALFLMIFSGISITSFVRRNCSPELPFYPPPPPYLFIYLFVFLVFFFCSFLFMVFLLRKLVFQLFFATNKLFFCFVFIVLWASVQLLTLLV